MIYRGGRTTRFIFIRNARIVSVVTIGISNCNMPDGLTHQQLFYIPCINYMQKVTLKLCNSKVLHKHFTTKHRVLNREHIGFKTVPVAVGIFQFDSSG